MGTYQGVGGSSDPPAQPFGPIKTSSFRARDRQRPMWRASLPIAKHFCWTRHGKLLPVNFWLKMIKPLKTFFLAIVEGLETVLKLCLRRRGDLGRRCYAPWRPGGRTRPFARNPRQGKGVNIHLIAQFRVSSCTRSHFFPHSACVEGEKYACTDRLTREGI